MGKNKKINLFKKIISIIILANIIFNINIGATYANTGKITSETVNMREKPTTESKILQLLPIEQEVEVISEEGDWYKIKNGDITGYVTKSLIKVEGQIEENKEENISKQENIQDEQQPKENEEKTEENNQVEENSQVENNNQDTTINKIKKDTKLKLVPLINANTILEAKTGEQVIVNETIGKWVCVTIQGKNGWVREDCLEISNEVNNNLENTEEQNQEEQTQEVVSNQNQEEQTQEEVKESNIMYVNTKSVNLRQEANKESYVKKSLAINTEVTVQETVGEWSKIKVQSENLEGYVLSSLLSKEKQEVSEEEQNQNVEQKPKTMYVNWEAVNLRNKPNTQSDVLKSILDKTQVEVIEVQGEWTKVRVDGLEGYILSSLLSE